MEQLFREPPAHPALAETDGEGCIRLPLIRFAVPPDATAAMADAFATATGRSAETGAVRKRARGKDDTAGHAPLDPTLDAPRATPLTCSPVPITDAQRAFIVYGEHSERPSQALLRLFSGRSPAALLSCGRPLADAAVSAALTSFSVSGADTCAATVAATLPTQRNAALLLALRQALAIVCRIVRLDTNAIFLLSIPPAPQPKPQPHASPSPALSSSSAIAPPGSTTCHGFLQLYCVLGGLELELEDAAARLRAAEGRTGHGCDKSSNSTSDAAHVDTARRIECAHTRAAAHLNAFETTVVGILLDDARFATRPAPPISYVASLLRSLPSVLAEESWPAQLLPSAAGIPPVARTAPIGVTGGDENDATAAAVRECLGCATTSILLRALRDVRAADCCSVLRTCRVAAAASDGGDEEADSSDTPVSVTAARMGLPDRSWAFDMTVVGGDHERGRGGSGAHFPSTPSPRAAVGAIDMETLSFAGLHARAWAGVFGQLGLRRADMEMQVLLHGIVLRASALTPEMAGAHGAANAAAAAAAAADTMARVGQVRYLKAVWQRSVTEHFTGLVAVDSTAREDGPLLTMDSFALTRASRAGNGCVRSKVQEAALNVLASLKAADKEGWFAVPAFDMANVDFSSIKCWIDSPSFASMSGWAAFDAIRGVLERMVDACVQRYGPTHVFSVCIVSIRQQLVDSARREGLLS